MKSCITHYRYGGLSKARRTDTVSPLFRSRKEKKIKRLVSFQEVTEVGLSFYHIPSQLGL
jgi:hypothetical protein